LEVLHLLRQPNQRDDTANDQQAFHVEIPPCRFKQQLGKLRIPTRTEWPLAE
jgi:hypothetical protein